MINVTLMNINEINKLLEIQKIKCLCIKPEFKIHKKNKNKYCMNCKRWK